MRTVTIIPAKPSHKVSITEIFEIVALIPKGKLMRYIDIENILMEYYPDKLISFEPITLDNFMNAFKDKLSIEEIIDVYFYTPWWRIISTNGLIGMYGLSVEICKDKLMRDGIKIENYRNGKSLCVNNFENKLIEYKVDIDANGKPLISIKA